MSHTDSAAPQSQGGNQNQTPAQQQYAPMPADDGTVMGALALALSCTFPPVGFVLAIVAMNKSKPHTAGHTLGLVGLICSILCTAFIILYIIVSIAAEFAKEAN